MEVCMCVVLLRIPFLMLKCHPFRPFCPFIHPTIRSRYLLNKAALDDQSRAASRMDVKVRERDNERQRETTRDR